MIYYATHLHAKIPTQTIKAKSDKAAKEAFKAQSLEWTQGVWILSRPVIQAKPRGAVKVIACAKV